jgi:ribosomal protein S26
MKTAGKGFNIGKGRGAGSGGGQGGGQGRGQGGGQGRNRGGAFGPGGYCVCAKCGAKLPHQRGIKCTTLKCPECGHTMIREELIKQKK